MIAALALLALCAPPAALAQSTAARAAASPLHFQISTPQSTYHVGEVIRIQLDFTSDVDHSFRILDQSTVVEDDGIDKLVLTPAEIAPRYDANTASLIRPGPGTHDAVPFTPLDTTGAHYSIVLNDRYVLKKPGALQVRIESLRVHADFGGDAGSASAPPFPLTSNTLSITVVPATPEWQASELAHIKADLDAHPRNADGSRSPEHQAAVDRLIYLNSPDAARELVRRFVNADDEDGQQYAIGMALSDYRSVAMDSANKLADDPSFGITFEFETLLAVLPIIGNVNPNDFDSVYLSARAAEEPQLLAALGSKQGKAFSTTLETTERLKGDDSSAALTAAVKQSVPKLIAMFRELPPDEQTDWLTAYWHDVNDPAWIPILRAIATEPVSPRSVVTGFYDPGAAAKSDALTNWAALDPEGARQTILNAMMSGQGKFGIDALSSLPDKTLPDAQQRQLAELFVSADGSAAQDHFAELLNRYGGATAWNAISTAVSQSLRTYTCNTQLDMLSLSVRVSPDAANTLFESSMAPPENAASDCRAEILKSAVLGEKSEVAEKYAIAALNDPNPFVVESAAGYLGIHGSAKAEEPLWRRYESWAAMIASKPPAAKGESEGDGEQTLQVGVDIADALEEGPNWLTDKEKLDRLNALAGDALGRPMVDADMLAPWLRSPVVVTCNVVSDDENQFTVAQYTTSTVDTLKARLALFPDGTTLAWDANSCSSKSNYAAMFNDIASAASIKGITLKPADALPASAPPATSNDGNGDDAPASANAPSPDAANIVPDRVVVVN